MKKVILILLMLSMLLFVTGCAPGRGEVVDETERNNSNIVRYEKLLASDELSPRERRTVQWYLDAAIAWRDSQ